MTLLVLILLLFSSAAHAATFHVNGNTGAGTACTSGSPCKTIAQGLSTMSGGDTLIVHGGTGGSCIVYKETQKLIPKSGSSGSYTTIQVQGGGHLQGGECAHIRPEDNINDEIWNTDNRSFVIIEGFKIDGGDASSNMTASTARRAGGTIYIGTDDNTHHIIIRNNETMRTRGSCIYNHGGTTLTVEGNLIHHCGWFTCNSYGIQDSGTGEVSTGDAHGMYFGAHDSLIRGNTFHHNPCYSIQIYGGDNMNNNIVENNSFSTSRCGTTMKGSGNIFRNNIMWDDGHNEELPAQWAGSNPCSGSKAELGALIDGGNGKFVNNTMFGHSIDDHGGNCGSGCEMSNNITCGGGAVVKSGSGTAVNNLSGTCPAFQGAGTGNFHLVSDDPALAPRNASALLDRDGVSRRTNTARGAYEFVTAVTPVATSLAFVQQPTMTVPGATITPAITVQVRDQTGAPMAFSASITLAIDTNTGSPPGTLSGTLTRSTNASTGLATFNDISINNAGVGYKLKVTSTPTLTQAISAAFTIGTQTTSNMGPLTVHPGNTRYFANGLGKATLLVGSHNWCTLIDPADPPQQSCVVPYATFLTWLTARHHNVTKFWANSELWGQDLLAYQRTGTSNANDGKPKIDFTAFNQAYFDRLRQYTIAARDNGIYVIIMGFDIAYDRWNLNWFNPANNVQGLDGGDCTASSCPLYSFPPANSTILTIQENLYKKIVDTVNDLDNVLYEVGNELHINTLAWQNHIADLIHSYEGTGANLKHHLVGITGSPIGMTDLFASHAEWISPGGTGGYPEYRDDPPAATGVRIVAMDTDHVGGDSASNPDVLWKNITRGNHFLLMELDGGPGFLTNPNYDPVRYNMGQASTYLQALPLDSMVPHGELTSTGYALAQPGAAYLVYQPNSANFTVTMQAGTYDVKWWNVTARTETTPSQQTFTSTSTTFTPPFTGPAVLVISAVASSTSQMVLHWKLDEGTGTTANDDTGNGHTGTLAGSPLPTWTTGKIGTGALTFNGQNNVTMSGSFTDPSYSWAMWVKGNAAPSASLDEITMANGIDSDNIWSFTWSATTARFKQAASHKQAADGAYITAQIPDVLQGNTWYHIAGTYDGTTLSVYLNGTLKATATATPTPAPAGNFRIGTDKTPGFGFPGALDDIRVYNYTITATQVQALYALGGTTAKMRVRHQVVFR